MSLTDFFIGFFLMNAMPHFVLGIWKGRMLSAFGFSPTANVVYGLVNFSLASGLFVSSYGLSGLAQHGIFAGALTILLIYLLTAQFLYRRFTGA